MAANLVRELTTSVICVAVHHAKESLKNGENAMRQATQNQDR